MFEVRLTKQPIKYLKKLPDRIQKAFLRCFKCLEENPFSIISPLHGPLKGKWKIPIGDFRIICSVDIDEKIIKIIFIGPRGDVYKK